MYVQCMHRTGPSAVHGLRMTYHISTDSWTRGPAAPGRCHQPAVAVCRQSCCQRGERERANLLFMYTLGKSLKLNVSIVTALGGCIQAGVRWEAAGGEIGTDSRNGRRWNAATHFPPEDGGLGCDLIEHTAFVLPRTYAAHIHTFEETGQHV